MKKIYYLILPLYLVGCAVQGPISGGPIDKIPPELVSIVPENFSIGIPKDQKIILTFSELINPISIYQSLTINNQDFRVKVKGKKIIVTPMKEWNTNFLIEIYINRGLSDYQSNALTAPLDFFYSFGDEIPSNKIHGIVFDIEDVINKYNLENSSILFEVGLFKILDSGIHLIKTVQTNSNLEFIFNAVENGTYSVVAIENRLVDINTDLTKRRYSISPDNVIVNSDESDSLSVQLNIANPISRENISSINFINQYYVNYTLTNDIIEQGVIDTIYNNFKENNFSGKALKISLPMENDFESYQTDLFEFIVPEVIDTIPPKLLSIDISETDLLLKFSEPLDGMNDIDLFYIMEDSNDVYLDLPYIFEDGNLSLKNSINFKIDDIVKEDMPSIFNLNVKKNIIKDLYGNVFADSIIAINLNNQIKNNQGIGSGGIFGKVLYNKENPIKLVVSLYNAETLNKQLVLVDQNYHFSFEEVSVGYYFLQVYENYNSDQDVPYPYFGGDWNSSKPSLKFSDIFGPIEVRANWDIHDMIIDLK